MIDKIKLVFALLLVALGVIGFYWLSESALVIRVLSVLGGMIGGAILFSTTAVGREFIGFSQEAIAEAKRVVWPSRKETMQTTLAVFVLVLVMAIFLWIVDVGFLWAVKSLMGRNT